MSNLKAIALTDEMIANLTRARDEMQAQHDETIAAIGAPKPTGSRSLTFLRLLRPW